MNSVLAAFDAKAQAWDDYTLTPLGKLRQELTLCHLAQHLKTPGRPLMVLDAGGGTGGYALPLAQAGHHVSLLDFSSSMLAIAKAKIKVIDSTLIERCAFYCDSIERVCELFPQDRFDMVLCHTLLEYVAEPWQALRDLLSLVRPGGMISLLLVNACAEPLRWAVAKLDPDQARKALSAGAASADLFGVPRRMFKSEAVRQALAREGAHVLAEYGVRIFADYYPAAKLGNPDVWAQLYELELSASDKDPYRALGRYLHLVGTKQGFDDGQIDVEPSLGE